MSDTDLSTKRGRRYGVGALVVTFVLMALVSFFQLYQDVRALFGKKVFEWAPVEEGIDI